MAGLAVDRAAWSSPWRHRAVRDKAVLSLGLLVVALFSPDWPTALAILIATCAVALVGARVTPALWFRAVALPFTFILTGALSVAVSVGHSFGPVLWRFGWIAVTPETLDQAALLLTRGFAGTAAVLLLATTTPMVDLVSALHRFRIPDPLIEIALLIYRLLFGLAEVAASVRQTQAGRLGYAGWGRSYRSLGLLLSSVLLRSWDQARRLESGLAGRGYENSLRTLPRDHTCSGTFMVFALGLVTLLGVLCWWRT